MITQALAGIARTRAPVEGIRRPLDNEHMA
jgi:hypothetical protein